MVGLSLAFLSLKMFYGYENTFPVMSTPEQAIVDYIGYYSNKQVKIKTKGHQSHTIQN